MISRNNRCTHSFFCVVNFDIVCATSQRVGAFMLLISLDVGTSRVVKLKVFIICISFSFFR